MWSDLALCPNGLPNNLKLYNPSIEDSWLGKKSYSPMQFGTSPSHSPDSEQVSVPFPSRINPSLRKMVACTVPPFTISLRDTWLFCTCSLHRVFVVMMVVVVVRSIPWADRRLHEMTYTPLTLTIEICWHTEIVLARLSAATPTMHERRETVLVKLKIQSNRITKQWFTEMN